jgi:MOSC domain-containing protein YiiM
LGKHTHNVFHSVSSKRKVRLQLSVICNIEKHTRRRTTANGGRLKLISLNVARPRLTVYKGQTVNTGIFKQPVAGPVPLRTLNLDGDRQADLSVHGGPYKAVYAYPSEHYPFWRNELPGMDLPWGMFGENFTTEGLCESDLHVGDRLQIGAAIVMVRQTRTPCYKLAAKFQRDDMLERFLVSGRSGVYFSVDREGTVEPEDSFAFLSHMPEAITIEEMNQLIATDRYNRTLLEKAIATPALPEDWREHFSQRLARTHSAHTI